MDDYILEDSSVPKGFKSNGSSFMYGRSQSDVYDWLSDIEIPSDYKACNIIEIKFKGSRKEFYLNLQNIDLKNGELVAVEGNRSGYDVGHVSLTGELARMQLRKKNLRSEEVIKKIYRRATPADVTNWRLAKVLELNTLYKARDLAKELDLSMKLTDVEYQADKSKAAFYYTANGRVDYRELIKYMSNVFNIRIEMRQIGIREETSRLGNIGPCGSYLCCHTWSTNFKTNSPFIARNQKVSWRQGNKFTCFIDDETENIDGSKSDDLKDETQERHKVTVNKALSCANVVGQDSITRFDNKEKKPKKFYHKNKKANRKGG